MQVNNIIKAVATAALLTGAALISTSSFAATSSTTSKHATVAKACKEKFSDTKSKEYKACVKEGMKSN